MAEEQKTKSFRITMGGGEWATVQYGIVEYLRRHPRMRAATACFGLAWIAGWVLTLMGFKWHSVVFPTVAAIFAAPTLLWLAVVSGPEFELTFPTPAAPTPKIETPKIAGLVDAETYGVEALNESYKSAENYARSGFRWSTFCLIAGIASGCGNTWLIAVRPLLAIREHTSTFVWALCAACFLLCGLFLLRSMLQFRRANSLHDKLLDLQKTLTAIRLLDRPQDQSRQISASFIATKLLERPDKEDKK